MGAGIPSSSYGVGGSLTRRGLGVVKSEPHAVSTDSDYVSEVLGAVAMISALDSPSPSPSDFNGFGGGDTGGAGAGGDF